jgi:hypothetical protein
MRCWIIGPPWARRTKVSQRRIVPTIETGLGGGRTNLASSDNPTAKIAREFAAQTRQHRVSRGAIRRLYQPEPPAARGGITTLKSAPPGIGTTADRCPSSSAWFPTSAWWRTPAAPPGGRGGMAAAPEPSRAQSMAGEGGEI